MDEEVLENSRFHYSCRVCLVSNVEGIQMAALFTTTYKHSLNICDMLTTCTSLDLSPTDGLPNLICTNCLANLITAYEFHLQCHKTDEEIRLTLGILSKSNNILISNSATKENVPLTLVNESDQQQSETIKVEIDVLTTDIPISDDLTDDIDPKQECEVLMQIDVNDDDEINEERLQDDDSESDYIAALDPATDSEDDVPLRKPKVKSVKVKKKKEFPCLVCGKMFNKNYRLIRHSNVHNSYGKPYECETCKIRFASESSLIRHAIKHTEALSETTIINERPRIYKCPECPREFLKQESLSSHLKTHKTQMLNKEYLCEYCPKKFSKMNLLTRHVKCHDEFKQHKCNICDRTFSMGAQLIDHMNRHRGVKPHVCNVCHKGML